MTATTAKDVKNIPVETEDLTFATCEVTGLEFKQRKGGVSLAPKLPPTLNMRGLNPITSCSKASRGLFVQLRVESIFTPLAISPSPSLRQLSTRYAIRAGRNSPDKEFRYLRTVHCPVLIRSLLQEGASERTPVRSLGSRSPVRSDFIFLLPSIPVLDRGQVRRKVSEDSSNPMKWGEVFPADCLQCEDFYWTNRWP